MSLVECGDIVLVTINRLNDSGKGEAELDGEKKIILGPMVKDLIGETVTAEIQQITDQDNAIAVCLNQSLFTGNYIHWICNNFIPESYSGEIIGNVDRISGSGNVIVSDSRFPEEILVYGSTNDIEPGQNIRIKLRGSSFEHKGRYRSELIGAAPYSTPANFEEWKKQVLEEVGVGQYDKTSVDKDLTAGNLDEETRDLEKLRQKAEDDASESPMKEVEASRSRYSRSKAVKEYAKERAAGEWSGAVMQLRLKIKMEIHILRCITSTSLEKAEKIVLRR
ncbi:hypothetical protein [Halomicrococcus sp. NG-SE-24]|uniref:hypothetical protein n=1 Tax=Halomicrococcus sp. NG-SE-24 TaxID=3436928 RepID=UPI003D952D09